MIQLVTFACISVTLVCNVYVALSLRRMNKEREGWRPDRPGVLARLKTVAHSAISACGRRAAE